MPGVDVLHVGTKGSEGLRNHRFGVLQGHQGRGLVVVPNDPQDRYLGGRLNLLTVNEGILQAVPDEDDRNGHQKAQQSPQRIIGRLVGGDLLFFLGGINHPGIRQISGHRDTRLRPLLQKVHKEILVEGEFAFDIHQVPLGAGQGGQ